MIGSLGEWERYPPLQEDPHVGVGLRHLLAFAEPMDTLVDHRAPISIIGDQQGNTLFGYDGDDRLDGKGGSDLLFGGSGGDLLIGGGGHDQLSGEAGDDNLRSGAGHDTIIGGSGFDTLQGGAGSDNFVFDLADMAPRDTYLTWLDPEPSSVEIDTIIDFDRDDTIQLLNADPDELSVSYLQNFVRIRSGELVIDVRSPDQLAPFEIASAIAFA